MKDQQETSTRPRLMATMQVNLEKQTQLCKGFLCILKEEQNALVSMDLQSLMRYSRKKEELLQHIELLDHAIQQSSAEIAKEYNAEEGSLAGVIQFLPFEMADELDGFRKKIREIREEIQVRNLVNKRFTEDTLTCLDDAIALITGSDGPQSVYAAHRKNTHKKYDASLFRTEV